MVSITRWRVLFLLTILVCLPRPATAKESLPHVVMVIAEREYRTDETLPEFARRNDKLFRTTLVLADPEDPNRLVGTEAIDDADVLVISVRRRTLPPEQLSMIRQHVAAGKPVIGLRTASHAFCLRNKPPQDGRTAWPEFDQQVFGGNYTNHYGNSLRAEIEVLPSVPQPSDSLLAGIESDETFTSGGSLYRVSPISERAVILMRGKVEGHPSEPVAWTFQRDDGGHSFYTSLGHIEDFQGPVLPQILINAINWSLKK